MNNSGRIRNARDWWSILAMSLTTGQIFLVECSLLVGQTQTRPSDPWIEDSSAPTELSHNTPLLCHEHHRYIVISFVQWLPVIWSSNDNLSTPVMAPSGTCRQRCSFHSYESCSVVHEKLDFHGIKVPRRAAGFEIDFHSGQSHAIRLGPHKNIFP